MAKEEIVVSLGEDGSVQLEGMGFKGNACDQAMEAFEQLGKVTSRKNKGEYYARGATAGRRLRVGGQG